MGASFVLNVFDDLLIKIILYKSKIDSGEWKTLQRNEEDSINAIWRDFLSLLREAKLEAQKKGTEYWDEIFNEALYIMASFTDEVFLNLDWNGKEFWRENLLEFALFKTYNAGSSYFKKLDLFIKNPDLLRTDTAKLYLYTLSFDFQGKYRGMDCEGILVGYQKKLYKIVKSKEPDLQRKGSRIFSEAYQHVYDNSPIILLGGRYGFWICIFLLFFVFFTIFSTLLWNDLTRSLNWILDLYFKG